MTPAEKVHMLEVERALVLPGRNSGAVDSPELCAARLAEIAIASAAREANTRRRAHQRARRKAAGQ